MKVALCLQGQPRNWKPSIFYLKKEIIDKYDADVFGHTWWDDTKIGDAYSVAPFAPQYKKYIIEQNTISDLQSVYQFKNFCYDAPKNFLTGKKYLVGEPDKHDSIVDALKSRYYSLKTVLSLVEEYEKEHNISYDWVCVSRYDIAIRFMPNLVMLNPHNHYVEDYLHSGRKYILNDNFWIFGRKHKFVFKTLFDTLDDTYEKMVNNIFTDDERSIIKGTELEFKHSQVLNGEQIMAFHLLFNNALQYSKQEKSIKYDVIP